VGEGTRVKSEKIEAVAELHAKFARAISAVLTDFRGLTVQEITELRQQLRGASLELAVVKNTLARLAVRETAFERLSPYLTGPTSITFSYRNSVAPAKVLSAYVKKQPKLAVRAGLFEGELVPAEKIAEIADLPPRDVILAQALAAMQGPMAGLVGTLQGVLSTFIGTLQAIHDKKAQG
jgi:large subunit ribosomal protein L10